MTSFGSAFAVNRLCSRVGQSTRRGRTTPVLFCVLVSLLAESHAHAQTEAQNHGANPVQTRARTPAHGAPKPAAPQSRTPQPSDSTPPDDTNQLKGYDGSKQRWERLWGEPRERRTAAPWSAVLGLGFRGTRSETLPFEQALGAEIGLGLPILCGADIAMGLGGLIAKGQGIHLEWVSRFFLFETNGGPYLGGGWRSGDLETQKPAPTAFASLGLFGGKGLYVEFDLRPSQARPLAAIVEVGFRWRAATGSDAPHDEAPKGPLVRNTLHRITTAAR